jgi:hypothetical protein
VFGLRSKEGVACGAYKMLHVVPAPLGELKGLVAAAAVFPRLPQHHISPEHAAQHHQSNHVNPLVKP